nr:hypothetical protein [Pseudarthrobacter psychrotolerans]
MIDNRLKARGGLVQPVPECLAQKIEVLERVVAFRVVGRPHEIGVCGQPRDSVSPVDNPFAVGAIGR